MRIFRSFGLVIALVLIVGVSGSVTIQALKVNALSGCADKGLDCSVHPEKTMMPDKILELAIRPIV